MIRVSFPAHPGDDSREGRVPESLVRHFQELLQDRIREELGELPVRVYPDWTGQGEIGAVPADPARRPGEARAMLDIERVRSTEKKLRQLLDEVLASDEWKSGPRNTRDS